MHCLHSFNACILVFLLAFVLYFISFTLLHYGDYFIGEAVFFFVLVLYTWVFGAGLYLNAFLSTHSYH